MKSVLKSALLVLAVGLAGGVCVPTAVGGDSSQPPAVKDPVRCELGRVADVLAVELGAVKADKVQVDGFYDADWKDHHCSAGYGHVLAEQLQRVGVKVVPSADFVAYGVARDVVDRYGLPAMELKVMLAQTAPAAAKDRKPIAQVVVKVYGVGVGAVGNGSTTAFQPKGGERAWLRDAIRPTDPGKVNGSVAYASGEKRFGLGLKVKQPDGSFKEVPLTESASGSPTANLKAGEVVRMFFLNDSGASVLAFVTADGVPVDVLQQFQRDGKNCEPGMPLVVKPGGDELHGFPVDERTAREFTLADQLPSEVAGRTGKNGAVTVLFKEWLKEGGDKRSSLTLKPGKDLETGFALESVAEGRPLATVTIKFARGK